MVEPFSSVTTTKHINKLVVFSSIYFKMAADLSGIQ